MAGIEVSRQGLDAKIGDALLQLRGALDKSNSIAIWLANNPVENGEDPLVVVFGYDPDEAYNIRYVFEQIAVVKTNTAALEADARKLTGLE